MGADIQCAVHPVQLRWSIEDIQHLCQTTKNGRYPNAGNGRFFIMLILHHHKKEYLKIQNAAGMP